MSNKHMKRCLILLFVREIQMKITMKYIKPPVEWLRFKLLMVASADKNTLFTFWRKKTLFSITLIIAGLHLIGQLSPLWLQVCGLHGS